jgi:hypothetical protein
MSDKEIVYYRESARQSLVVGKANSKATKFNSKADLLSYLSKEDEARP